MHVQPYRIVSKPLTPACCPSPLISPILGPTRGIVVVHRGSISLQFPRYGPLIATELACHLAQPYAFVL